MSAPDPLAVRCPDLKDETARFLALPAQERRKAMAEIVARIRAAAAAAAAEAEKGDKP